MHNNNDQHEAKAAEDARRAAATKAAEDVRRAAEPEADRRAEVKAAAAARLAPKARKPPRRAGPRRCRAGSEER